MKTYRITFSDGTYILRKCRGESEATLFGEWFAAGRFAVDGVWVDEE